MKAMLLAAGEGTRFRPQTLKTPKPGLPFLNVPLGYYSFPFMKSAGVDSLVINTFHLPQMIEQIYSEQKQFKVNFSPEVGKILGSGGGLGFAKKYLSKEENFFLLNADEILIPQNPQFLQEMTIHHLKNKPISTLLVMQHPGVGSQFGGIWVDSKNQIVGYGKIKPEDAVHGFHYLGCQILNKNIFNFIDDGKEQNILYDNLSAAQKAGHHVDLFEIKSYWYETGSLLHYLNATREILSHLSQKTKKFEALQNFLNEFAPDSQMDQTNGAVIWKNAKSEIINCEFKNFAVIGKDVIAKNCKIESAVLGNSTSFNTAIISKNLFLY